jgi:hypothetical protein
MSRRVALVVGLAVVTGCNLLSGASALDFATESEPSQVPDAAEAAVLPRPDAAIEAQADAAPDADVDAASTPLRVFISSTERDGRFGGLAAADLVCANLATTAKLGGTWVAWLSVKNGAHAIDRLTSTGPWHLVTGELVASNKTQLVSGMLAHGIDRDERGAVPSITTDGAWTGTGVDGRFSGADCNGWKAGEQGTLGESEWTDGRWTSFLADGCGNPNRFYCFQL